MDTIVIEPAERFASVFGASRGRRGERSEVMFLPDVHAAVTGDERLAVRFDFERCLLGEPVPCAPPARDPFFDALDDKRFVGLRFQKGTAACVSALAFVDGRLLPALERFAAERWPTEHQEWSAKAPMRPTLSVTLADRRVSALTLDFADSLYSLGDDPVSQRIRELVAPLQAALAAYAQQFCAEYRAGRGSLGRL